MVICRICRSSLPNNCRFCRKCGYQIGELWKQANLRSFQTFTRVLMIASIALFLLLGTEGIYFVLAQTQPQAQSKSASSVTTPIVTSLGQQYMDALLAQKYAEMWSMLHPQIRAMWPNQEAFSRYLQLRFEDYTLQGFSLGKVSHLSTWINPETMVQYKDVESMPISLKLSSRLAPDEQEQLAPQFRQPSPGVTGA